jgi:hypothetical protein
VCFSNPRFLRLGPERRIFLTSLPPFIIIRMHSLVGRDLALLREPDRRIARPADVFKRDAGLGFIAMAFDL